MRKAGYVRVRVDAQTYSLDQPPEIDRRRKHRVEVVIDRLTVAAGRPARGWPAASRTPWPWAAACSAWPFRGRTCPSPHWPTEIHSQHFACEQCGRSFEPLGPHHFSFNSPLGWCPACEGLGVQTGTNPAALLRDPKLTLAQGAVALWPDAPSGLFRGMLESLAARLRHPHGRALRAARRQAPPADLPRHRRAVVRRGSSRRPSGGQGTGAGGVRPRTGPDPNPTPDFPTPHSLAFRFQYKGLYPALEEASRVSPGLARPAGAPRRRSRVYGLRRQPAARRCGGRAVPRPHDRRVVPHAAGQAAGRSPRVEARPPSPSGRSPARCSARSATARSSSSTWAWST